MTRPDAVGLQDSSPQAARLAVYQTQDFFDLGIIHRRTRQK
jgi:hypothetical protein